MKSKIDKAISELQASWKDLSIEAVSNMRSILTNLIDDPSVKSELQAITQNLQKGIELYRDQTGGFILLAYSEPLGTYRPPHDHGRAWVIYTVVAGEVEMGSYFNGARADGSDHLIHRSLERLSAGDMRIYFPGEIHDTRTTSESSVILRLTSLDLRVEEAAGRLKRYQCGEVKCS